MKLIIIKPEEHPEIMAAMIRDCEKTNEANPDLIRINHNTWIDKKDKQNYDN